MADPEITPVLPFSSYFRIGGNSTGMLNWRQQDRGRNDLLGLCFRENRFYWQIKEARYAERQGQ